MRQLTILFLTVFLVAPASIADSLGADPNRFKGLSCRELQKEATTITNHVDKLRDQYRRLANTYNALTKLNADSDADWAITVTGYRIEEKAEEYFNAKRDLDALYSTATPVTCDLQAHINPKDPVSLESNEAATFDSAEESGTSRY